MLAVTIEEAEAQLSELIDAALSGEDVVIARGGQPVVRLVPVSVEDWDSPPAPPEARRA